MQRTVDASHLCDSRDKAQLFVTVIYVMRSAMMIHRKKKTNFYRVIASRR